MTTVAASQARTTFNTLPLDLKALVIEQLAIADDQPSEAPQDRLLEFTQTIQRPGPRLDFPRHDKESLKAVSLVNHELSGVARPILWRSLSLVRPWSELLEFAQGILPSVANLVQVLFLSQHFNIGKVEWEQRHLLGLVTDVFELANTVSRQLDHVDDAYFGEEEFELSVEAVESGSHQFEMYDRAGSVLAATILWQTVNVKRLCIDLRPENAIVGNPFEQWDYAFAAVGQHLGPKLVELALVRDGYEEEQEDEMRGCAIMMCRDNWYLERFVNLQSLKILCGMPWKKNDFDSCHPFKTISKMAHLKQLALFGSSIPIRDSFLDRLAGWSCAFTHLELNELGTSTRGLAKLLQAHHQTLVHINLDGGAREKSDGQTFPKPGPFNKLKSLFLSPDSADQFDEFVTWFETSPVVEFGLGFYTQDLLCEVVVDFVKSLAKTLKHVVLDARLDMVQNDDFDELSELCEDKGIELHSRPLEDAGFHVVP
ncbi:hypothetical protein ACM66B_003220 [Microbotryomycetes sp. NB124-2]